jgi:hypothetical protein
MTATGLAKHRNGDARRSPKAAQLDFLFTVSSIDKIYGDAPFTVPLTGC